MQTHDEGLRTLRYDTSPAGIVLLAILIGACVIAVCVVLAVSKGLERIGKLEKAHSEIVVGLTSTMKIVSNVSLSDCDAPAKSGDRTVIVVRRDGERLTTHCNRLIDWRDPARTLKDKPANAERNGSRSESDCRAKLGDLECKHG